MDQTDLVTLFFLKKFMAICLSIIASVALIVGAICLIAYNRTRRLSLILVSIVAFTMSASMMLCVTLCKSLTSIDVPTAITTSVITGLAAISTIILLLHHNNSKQEEDQKEPEGSEEK